MLSVGRRHAVLCAAAIADREVRRSHHFDIDGEEREHSEDRGKEMQDPEADAQDRRDKPGDTAGSDRRRAAPRAAARRADQRLTVNQRRLRVGPLAWLAAEIRAEIFLPAYRARADLHAGQIAVGAERVERFTLHGRRGAGGREVGILLGIAHLAETSLPNPFAVLDGERLNELVMQSLVAQQIEPVRDDGGCRVARPDIGHFPVQFRTFLGPFFQQAGFLREAVAIWPAPLRPVGRRNAEH